MKLGYEYYYLKHDDWDKQANILPSIFGEALKRINTDLTDDDIKRLLIDINLELSNNNLGEVFFNRLQNQSGV